MTVIGEVTQKDMKLVYLKVEGLVIWDKDCWENITKRIAKATEAFATFSTM